MNELIYKDFSNRIIQCFYNVYNTLGFGFLEKVYENAMMVELRKNGLFAEKQKPIEVYYGNQMVGSYFADIIVESKIILELKAAECLIEEHELQLINYLKATELELGLLLNFGKKPEFKRKIFTNDRKKIKRDNTNNPLY
jgi:GxxExxY protein